MPCLLTSWCSSWWAEHLHPSLVGGLSWLRQSASHANVIFGVLVYLWLYNAPSRVSHLGSSLVRLLYPAEDGKSTLSLISSNIHLNIVLYPPLQSPCILCDQGPLYRLHFHNVLHVLCAQNHHSYIQRQSDPSWSTLKLWNLHHKLFWGIYHLCVYKHSMLCSCVHYIDPNSIASISNIHYAAWFISCLQYSAGWLQS